MRPLPQVILQSLLDESYRFVVTLTRVQVPRQVVPLGSWIFLLLCHGLLSYPFFEHIYRRQTLSFGEIDRPAGFFFLSVWFLLLLVVSCVLWARGPRTVEAGQHDHGRPIWAWGWPSSPRLVWWLDVVVNFAVVAVLFTPTGSAWYYQTFGHNDILRCVVVIGVAWRLVRETCGTETQKGDSTPPDSGPPNAVWAKEEDIVAAGLRRPPGLYLGHWDGKPMYTDGEGNIILAAPARSGKSSCNVIPLCKEAPNDLIILDVKGEIHLNTAADRIRLGHTVVRWDPFGVRGPGGACFNPFTLMDRNDPNLNEHAILIVDLILQVDPNERDHHFHERARKYLIVVVLYVLADVKNADQRNLGHVRYLLTRPANVFECILEEMSRSQSVGGLISDGANIILAADPRERANVLATVHRHITFLDTPVIRTHLASTTFDPSAFAKECSTDVYMIMPPDKLAAYSRLIRIWIGCTLHIMTRAQGRPAGSERLCMVLDEFSQLGRIPQILQAMTALGGYSVSIYGILQNLGQLRTSYPNDEWHTILANSKYQMYSCVNDVETAHRISDSLGAHTIVVEEETVGQSQSYTRGSSWAGWWASLSGSDVNRQRTQQQGSNSQSTKRQFPLLSHDKVMRLHPDKQILLVASTPPILAEKIPYYKKIQSPWRFWRR